MYEYKVHNGEICRGIFPTEYTYDAYGRMTHMYTYRSGTGFTGDTWPTGNDPDITEWIYQETTGLLEEKIDDAGNKVTYTYTTDGKLETRTWARLNGSDPLITTYFYFAATGELQKIDYSDTTQDVEFTYDRLGRQKTITDAVGTRTFAYNDAMQLESEIITGLYNKTITRTYEGAGVIGRPNGFTLGSDYTVSYGFEANTGRFNAVNWTVDGKADSVSYNYLANSDLVETLTAASGYQASYC